MHGGSPCPSNWYHECATSENNTLNYDYAVYNTPGELTCRSYKRRLGYSAWRRTKWQSPFISRGNMGEERGPKETQSAHGRWQTTEQTRAMAELTRSRKCGEKGAYTFGSANERRTDEYNIEKRKRHHLRARLSHAIGVRMEALNSAMEEK